MVTLYWSTSSSAQGLPNTYENNTQQLAGNNTNGVLKETPESDVSKKFFLHVDHDDDFYPKPHFPSLFYPFIHHHEPDHYESDHYESDHYDKPKPPVHKPPPKPIHKPEHHKPPIVIHHKPVHKPVHIHIHKPSLHALKPPHKPILHEHIHKPIQHEHHHKPVHHEEHHKPVHHKPHKDDCDSNCTGIKLGDGVGPDFSEDELYELSADEDGTKYSVDQDSDQTYIYSQVEPTEDFEKYEINHSTESYNNPSKPNSQNPQDYLSGGNGIRKPVISLSDFISDMRPVPWYSQHQEEKGPVRKPPSEDISHHSNSNPDHDKTLDDHKKPCHVHHHYHYYYPAHYLDPHHPHVPHHPPVKPHVPSYYPKDERRDSRASSTESSLAETVDPKITIPYNEYDVSTKATAEEEKPEEESHSPKPSRKPKPKPRPISQMLLWPFTPKPARTRASKKPQTTENDK